MIGVWASEEDQSKCEMDCLSFGVSYSRVTEKGLVHVPFLEVVKENSKETDVFEGLIVRPRFDTKD